MREYRSFDEIDRDLKLLKLQSEVDKEMIILSYNNTKASMAPKAVLKRTAGAIFKSALIYKSASKILGFIGDRLHKERRN